METTEDGSTQPVLSVTIRENATSAPFHRQSADTTDVASRQSDVSRDKPARIDRGESAEEADGQTDWPVECSAARCACIEGSVKMLDLVTASPLGCTVDSISDPCNISGASSNGFTGPNLADGGGSHGTGTGKTKQEKDLQALSFSEQTKNASIDVPSALDSDTRCDVVESSELSHNGQREKSCGPTGPSQTGPGGLLNGDPVAPSPSGDDAVSRLQSERCTEAKMSNGGLSSGHCCSETSHSETDSPSQPGGTDVCVTPVPTSSSSSTARGPTTREPGRTGARSRTRENVAVVPTGPFSRLGVRPSAPAKTTHPDTSPDPANAGKQAEEDVLGLAYQPPPGPRPLLSSVSYDCSPVSPGDQAVDGEEAPAGPGFTDVSLNSRNTYESSRRQSAPGHLPPGLDVVDPSEQALQSKRPGIADYFGRSLFSKRQRDHSVPGWKLFGKVPLRESPTKDSRTIQQEYEAKLSKPGNSPTQNAPGRRKNLEFEPLSTTALILEDRPANLPAKSVEEAQRHRQEYEEMVAEAKKREMREAQRKQKQMKERIRQEEGIATAMLVWNNDILPHWDSMKNSRRARELWWQGLPPNVRGRVWSLAIANELNITPELYEIFLCRAREKWRLFSETGSEGEAEDGASLADRESSLDLIKLDISRTFPSLFIFQKGGPYHDVLHSVLGAYTCYRPDVGYVQGMSFIAAVLILNLEEADAFIAFANLLNKPCQLAFFRVDHDLMLKYFAAFEVFFEENLPRLFNHFQTSSLTPDLYLIDWIFTLYSKPLPLDVACRVWDVFCRDGEEFLFQTGLGILRLYQDTLLQMDFIHGAQFLARLPEDSMLSDRLFSCIAATPMVSGNRRWTQVFNALIKDNKDVDKNTSMALKS